MNYEIVKSFNNNVILIKNNEENCVLISKGVGFGKKKGDKIDISDIKENKKIFYTQEEYKTRASIKKLENSMKILEDVTKAIINEAYLELGIQSDNLYNGIFEHVAFAVESLKAGIPIQNPFINEIKILCSDEFKIAQNGAKLIEKTLSVSLLDGEKALIALHLHSARKNQNIASVTIDIMVYSKILELIENITYTNESYRSFILSVNSIISSYKNSNKYLFSDNLLNNIKNDLCSYYDKAQKVSNLLKEELLIDFINETLVCLLAIEIYKLENS